MQYTNATFSWLDVSTVSPLAEASTRNNQDGSVSVSIGPLHALDLRGRGITSIAPEGLSCFYQSDPSPSINDDVPNVPTDLFFLNSSVTQAILLDNNRLTEVPNAATVNYTSFVSLSNNAITTIPANAIENLFGNTMSRAIAYVDLSSNGVVSVVGPLIDFNTNTFIVNLAHNSIATVPQLQPPSAEGGVQSSAVFDFSHNTIREIPSDAFSVGGFIGLNNGIYADFSSNLITAMPPGLTSAVQTLFVNVSGNNITTLAQDTFGGAVPEFNLDVSLNNLTEITASVFAGYFGTSLRVSALHNPIQSIPVGAFNFPSGSANLTLDVSFCNMTSLEDSLFLGFGGTGLAAKFSHCGISTVRGVFRGYNSTANMNLDISDNPISSLQPIFRSLSSIGSDNTSLLVNCTRCNVAVLPANVLEGVAAAVTPYGSKRSPPVIGLSLAQNPLTYISRSAFCGGSLGATFQDLFVDLSNIQARINFNATTPFFPTGCNLPLWSIAPIQIRRYTSFLVDLSNSNVNLSIVSAFITGSLSAMNVDIKLSNNNYSGMSLPAGLLAGFSGQKLLVTPKRNDRFIANRLVLYADL